MGIISDFLSIKGPLVGVGYGAAAELYDRANIKAGDQQKLFQGLGQDLRVERSSNNKLLNDKLNNFKSAELDFIQNAAKYNLDYDGYSEDQLRAIWAPMAEYLKGDTFVGKAEDVQKKITSALEMSGGIKVDDPYTSVKEFEAKTKQAINKPLEMYSGLAYNTWQNQVGDITYKTPEYDQTESAMEGLRITAYNFPQFYPTQGGIESPAMTVARMSVLNYNARQDATDANGVFDPWTFDKLRDERFKKIQSGPNRLDTSHAASLFGIKEEDLIRLVTAESPFLKGITTMSAQLANKDLPTEERNAIIQNVGSSIIQHVGFLKNVNEGMFEKVITEESLDTKEGEKLAKTVLRGNFDNDAFKIHDMHVNIASNPNSVKGISLPANAASNKIPEHEGRIAEQFAFVAVPQGMTEDGIALPKKWLAVSNTGVMFELPGANLIKNIQAGKVTTGRGVSAAFSKDIATVENFAVPNAELKTHAMTAVKYAMEGKIKLNFVRKSNNQFVKDNSYVKALESAGVFGKNPVSGMPIKYFGQ